MTLNIEYQAGGIRIWTEGINEEVIAYCRERPEAGQIIAITSPGYRHNLARLSP